MTEIDKLLAIFDHDGVLVDSLQLHQDAWVELGRREDLPLTAEFIHETFGMTNPSIFRKLLGEDVSGEEMARLGAIKEACYRDSARGRIVLMVGVREVLDRLRGQPAAAAGDVIAEDLGVGGAGAALHYPVRHGRRRCCAPRPQPAHGAAARLRCIPSFAAGGSGAQPFSCRLQPAARHGAGRAGRDGTLAVHCLDTGLPVAAILATDEARMANALGHAANG